MCDTIFNPYYILYSTLYRYHNNVIHNLPIIHIFFFFFSRLTSHTHTTLNIFINLLRRRFHTIHIKHCFNPSNCWYNLIPYYWHIKQLHISLFTECDTATSRLVNLYVYYHLLTTISCTHRYEIMSTTLFPFTKKTLHHVFRFSNIIKIKLTVSQPDQKCFLNQYKYFFCSLCACFLLLRDSVLLLLM